MVEGFQNLQAFVEPQYTPVRCTVAQKTITAWLEYSETAASICTVLSKSDNVVITICVDSSNYSVLWDCSFPLH